MIKIEPVMIQANTHKECLCYQKWGQQTISLGRFPKGEKSSSLLTSHHILFVLEGAAQYTITGAPSASVVVGAGEFIFLPTCTIMNYEALEDTSVLRVRLSHMVGKIPECHTFRFQRLSGKSGVAREHAGIYPLKTNRRIDHFLEGLLVTERDGLKCGSYAQLVVGQLLFLIQIYYPQQEYMRFYSTVASCDVTFSDLVYEKWMECKTIGSLSQLLNMTTQQFTLQFRRVFGESPGVWLKKRRSERIYHDICSSHKTLKSIAAEHRFSMTNFVRYCRANFQSTLGAIRKSLSPADYHYHANHNL